MTEITRPIPRPAPESEPYWQAAREHRLELPRCGACGRFWFPPSRSCPHCLSPKLTWQRVSGRGQVFSYVIYDRTFHPAFENEVPYAVALIELEEGPRLISNVIGIAPQEIHCDMAVEVVFDEVAEGVVLPKFRPR